jgi:hypothetical protein
MCLVANAKTPTVVSQQSVAITPKKHTLGELFENNERSSIGTNASMRI